MSKLSRVLVNFLRNEDGPTAVEYGVVLVLILVVCITVVATLGSNARNTYTTVKQQVGTSS
jgi:pilus assembly protein Flp/PilA